MENRKWTKIFHISILAIFTMTAIVIIISRSNINSLYINELNETKTSNLYGSVVELKDFHVDNKEISSDRISTFSHNINQDMIGKYLVFFSYHSTVKATLIDDNDEQIIYQLLTSDIFKRSTATNVNFIKIPLESSGKTLKIEIQGCYDSIAYPDIKFFYGEKFDFLVHYIQEDIFNISIELAMLLFSLVVCLISAICLKYKSSVLDMLYLGLFTLTFSLWCLSGTKVVHILFQQPFRILYVNYFCFDLTSLFLMLYIRGKTYGKNIKKSTLTYTILAHIMFVVVIGILQLLNIKDIRETVSCLDIMIAIEVFLICKYNIYYINKNRNTSVLEFLKANVALCSLLVAVIIAVFQYSLTSQFNPALLNLSIFIYVASLVFEAVRDLYTDIELGKQSTELKQIAYTDTLTNLKNRNAFISDTKDLSLNNLIIIAFDLNSLKYYNDNFGHDMGDKLLIAMADILKNVFGDRAYRIGGDEFEVIMYNSNELVVDTLLLKFEQKEKEYNATNNHGIKVQAAYGYCAYNENEDYNINIMINTADKRMYEHKKYLKSIK